jgi:hypothetical protein
MFSRFTRPGIASTYLGTAPCQFLSELFFARRLMFSEQSLDGFVHFTELQLFQGRMRFSGQPG